MLVGHCLLATYCFCFKKRWFKRLFPIPTSQKKEIDVSSPAALCPLENKLNVQHHDCSTEYNFNSIQPPHVPWNVFGLQRTAESSVRLFEKPFYITAEAERSIHRRIVALSRNAARSTSRINSLPSLIHPHPLHGGIALLLNEAQARWGIALRQVYMKVEGLVLLRFSLRWCWIHAGWTRIVLMFPGSGKRLDLNFNKCICWPKRARGRPAAS